MRLRVRDWFLVLSVISLAVVCIWAAEMPEKPDCSKPQHGIVIAKVYVMGGRPELDRWSAELKNKDCTVGRLISKDQWGKISVGGEATF